MADKQSEQQAVLRTLAAGDVLFEEGDVGNVAYVVESGVIEICRFTGEEYVTLVDAPYQQRLRWLFFLDYP